METLRSLIGEPDAQHRRDRMASLKKALAQRVVMDLSRVDWDLLRRQKTILVELAASPQRVTTRRDREAIEGVINLLDHIQDETAIALGERTVFGRSGR